MEEKGQNKVQESNKVNGTKVAGIVAIIIAIISLGMSIFVIYNNNHKEEKLPNEKEENKEQETEEETPKEPDKPEEPEEKEEEISQELALKLYEQIFIDEVSPLYAFDYFIPNKLTTEDLTNQEKNRVVILNLLYEAQSKYYAGEIGDMDIFQPNLTEKQIMKTKDRVLGKDTAFEINLNKEDTITGHDYFVKRPDGTYTTIFPYEPSFVPSMAVKGEFTKKVKKGDFIYIEERTLFVEDIDDVDGKIYVDLYQDPERKNFLEKKQLIEGKETVKGEFRAGINVIDMTEFQEVARIYRFTFQDNGDGTYHFVQIERVK